MTARRETLTTLAAFFVLYVVWGTTYVANKFLVMDLPPLLAAGTRFVAAGLVMVALAMHRGAKLPQAAIEWRHVLVLGFCTVVLSNSINVMGLRYVPSNQAALLNASSAFWIALLGTVGSRGHVLPARVLAGLALGFAGVALLLWPHGGFSGQHLGWQLAMLGGCLGWAIGVMYYRLVRPATAPLMVTALQMLCGGTMTTLLGLANGDVARWQWTLRGQLSLVYLILFGSCLAYAAFTYLMTRTTPARLGTYAYVNPVVAALLGWWLLGETLSPVQLVGSGVILAGVALVSLPAARPAATPDEPGA